MLVDDWFQLQFQHAWSFSRGWKLQICLFQGAVCRMGVFRGVVKLVVAQ